MAVKTALIKFDAEMTAAYKQAVQAYANIQKTVNGMSAQWQRANSGLIAHVNYMRQAQVVMQQNSTALRNVVNSQKQNAQHSQAMATAWKSTKSSVGYVSDKMHSLISLGKRFGLFALAGAGGSIYGLDRLATSLSSSYTSATGLGMSYGQRQAFGLAFGRFGDTKSMLGAVSTGRLDTSSPQAQALWGAGINPMGGGSTSSMALKYLNWIQSKVAGKSDAELGYLMKGYHTDLMGYGPELLRNVRDRPDEVEQQLKKYAHDAQELDMNKKLLVGWQNFLTALDTAGENLKVIFGKAFVGLADPLSKLSVAITETIKALVGGENFKWAIEEIAKGIKSLGEYLNGADFKADLKDFGEGLKKVAISIRDFYNFFWGDHGPSTSERRKQQEMAPSTRPSRVENEAAIANKIGSAAGSVGDAIGGLPWGPDLHRGGAIGGNKFGGHRFGASAGGHGRSVSGFGGGSPRIGGSGGTSDGDAIDFFMSRGWSKDSAIGIVANIIGESGGNPFAVGDGGQAYGIAQWHPDRRAEYEKLFGHSMESVKDFAQAKREQLEFINWELHNSHANAGMRIGGASSAEDAAEAGVRHYEITGNMNKDSAIRRGIAGDLKRGLPQSSISIHNYTGSAISVSGSNMGVTSR